MSWRAMVAVILLVGCTSGGDKHGTATGGGAGEGAGAAGGASGGVTGGVAGASSGGVVAGGVSGATGVSGASGATGVSGATGASGAGGVGGASNPVCGNGVVEGPSEKCEGTDPGSATCESLGFDGGTLACRECLYDTSECEGITWNAMCGDGATGAHACDGGSAPCNELQFSVGLTTLTGTATCNDNCTWSFDECEGWPGGDLCSVANRYDDGWCDPCQLYGGAADPDCATVCGPPLDVGAGGAGGGSAGASAGGAEGLVTDGFCTDQLVGHLTNCEVSGFERDPDCGMCGDGVITLNGYGAGTEYCENAADGPIFINHAVRCSDWGYQGGVLSCGTNCVPNFANCY